MMDFVLGPNYRGKGVLKYILTKADEQLRDGVGFRVKNVAAGNDWYVKDTYYVVNVLVRTYVHALFPSKTLAASPPLPRLRCVRCACKECVCSFLQGALEVGRIYVEVGTLLTS